MYMNALANSVMLQLLLYAQLDLHDFFLQSLNIGQRSAPPPGRMKNCGCLSEVI